MSAASSAAAAGVANGFQLAFRHIADVKDDTFEMQVLSCVGVVKVDRHLVICDLANLRFDDLPVHGVHRYDSTYIDALAVKLTVAVEEHRLRQIHQSFLQVLAVGIACSKHEIEVISRLFALHLGFKSG